MTEFYGNSDYKRVRYIDSYPLTQINDATWPIGFINSKGMLMEYIIKNHKEGYSTTSKGKRKNCDHSTVYFDNRCMDMEKVTYKGEEYLVGKECRNFDELYSVYQELPMFINDENFKWRDNPKFGAKEANIESGSFEYHIIARENNTAYIEVRYTKCENKHRTKVTIAEITVYFASNEAILEAIRSWKNEFRDSL